MRPLDKKAGKGATRRLRARLHFVGVPAFVMLNEVKHLAMERDVRSASDEIPRAMPRSFAALRMTESGQAVSLPYRHRCHEDRSHTRPTRAGTLRHASAFTLVELLVSVAVVGFVLSILVPALERGRGHANLILCRTRLRSLTLGCLMYANDHDSHLPVEERLDNPHRDLIRMLGGASFGAALRDFYCPSERRPELCLLAENFHEGNISYFYYSFEQRPTNPNLSNFLLKSLPWPRLLKTTMAPDTWVLSDSWFSNMPTAHRGYAKGVNYGVMDGSVSMVTQSPRRDFK